MEFAGCRSRRNLEVSNDDEHARAALSRSATAP
jgi:hypothetical protein